MLLTITLDRPDARDLGYLLHKHPDRAHATDLAFGRALVFFPEATPERCTAALHVEVDPIGLVRGRRGGSGEGLLDQYVNDRPDAASSLLSVAIGQAFRTALGGTCKDRPELAAEALPWEARIASLPCRGGEALLRRLFEPLGHEVHATRMPLDPLHEDWGDGAHHDVVLRGRMTLQALLAHLYVLIPVLDDQKHYYVGPEEIDKLLRRGEGWLATHPERELIVRRALRHERKLTREALARLVSDESESDPDAAAETAGRAEDGLEKGIGLDQARRDFVLQVLRREGSTSVVDVGCGEGRLLKALLPETRLSRIAGMDVSLRSLQRAERRLGLADMPDRRRQRVELLHGSAVYVDPRLKGFDAAVAVEVVEHLEPHRLGAFTGVLFGRTAPPLIVITTPNAEYNALFPSLPAGAFRHADHRFEWTREQFATWADETGRAHGYSVELHGIGPCDEALGAPTQAGVFRRE